MSSAPPESFLALMGALNAVVDHRLRVQLRQIGREKIKGKEPHPDLVINADRSQYLSDSTRDATRHMAEIQKAYREYCLHDTSHALNQLMLALSRVFEEAPC